LTAKRSGVVAESGFSFSMFYSDGMNRPIWYRAIARGRMAGWQDFDFAG
jgi:hypothetical protein